MENLLTHRSQLFDKELLQKIINEGEDKIETINTLKHLKDPRFESLIYGIPVYRGKLKHFQLSPEAIEKGFTTSEEYNKYCEDVMSKEPNVRYVNLYVEFLEGMPITDSKDELYLKHLNLDYEVIIYIQLS